MVCGIDPSSKRTGYGMVMDGELRASGVVEALPSESVYERVRRMASTIADVLTQFGSLIETRRNVAYVPYVPKFGPGIGQVFRDDFVVLVEWAAGLGNRAHPSLVTAQAIVAAFPLVHCQTVLVDPRQWKSTHQKGKLATMTEAQALFDNQVAGVDAAIRCRGSKADYDRASDAADAVVMAARFESFAKQWEAMGQTDAVDVVRNGRKFHGEIR